MIIRPWMYKIELSRGCNLSCKFCPIYAIPEYSEWRFLSPKMARRIVEGIHEMNPRSRIEMTMRGEPTLNPELEQVLRSMREASPEAQLSMHTNGVLLLKGQYGIADLLDFGVNILNIDCYNNTEDRFHKMACDELAGGADFDLADHESFSAYRRHTRGHELRVVNLIPDIAAPDNPIRVRQIHSNAGNSDPKMMEELGVDTTPRTGKCARPFRECVITYDGKVLLCCHDWKAEAVLGDLHEQSLSEIWYGKEHQRHLRHLYKGERGCAPCDQCDYHGGYRLALLKDPG